MGISFFNESVTRIRPKTKTMRGSTVPDWSDVTTAVITNCHVQPSSTSLTQDGRVLGISETFTLYASPNADIEAGDRIEWNGKVFRAGDPRPWASPTGAVSTLQVTLERWSG